MMALRIDLRMEAKNKIYVNSKNVNNSQFYPLSHAFSALQTIPFSHSICIPDLKSNLKTYAQQGSKSPLQSNICLANMEETKQPKQNHFPDTSKDNLNITVLENTLKLLTMRVSIISVTVIQSASNFFLSRLKIHFLPYVPLLLSSSLVTRQ